MTAARNPTPAEMQLMRHALGLPNRHGVSYRNRYVCFYAPTRHLDAWERMEARGWAFSKHFSADRIVFYLTYDGATLALEPGERLDAEDFPETAP